jgi:hypothetical protein
MDELTQTRKAAYEAACLAENLWQDELCRVYGKKSLEARYDRKRNRATPMLAALHDVLTQTTDTWRLLGAIARKEIA